MNKPISTLIVDDSPLVRQVLSDIIREDSELSIAGTASDPYEAVQIIQKKIPDVITLDIEMPRMDGITFLKKLMSQHPIPVIVLSAHTQGNKQLALKAFEYGAMYVMNKPEVESEVHFREYSIRLRELIKMAAQQKDFKHLHISSRNKISSEEIDSKLEPYQRGMERKPQIIAIGASAGGTMAIQKILSQLNGSLPPIVITQHMPEGFTREFAKRLNTITELKVTEANDGEQLQLATVYIAPGNQHLTLVSKLGILYTRLDDSPPINHHKPSVDMLFDSIAQTCAINSLSFLLTGMGKDGASGLLKIRKAGGITMAQDKHSSVVYGMPAEAKRIGAAQYEIGLDLIGPLINTTGSLR